jgi:hypothetical protein
MAFFSSSLGRAKNLPILLSFLLPGMVAAVPCANKPAAVLQDEGTSTDRGNHFKGGITCTLTLPQNPSIQGVKDAYAAHIIHQLAMKDGGRQESGDWYFIGRLDVGGDHPVKITSDYSIVGNDEMEFASQSTDIQGDYLTESNDIVNLIPNGGDTWTLEVTREIYLDLPFGGFGSKGFASKKLGQTIVTSLQEAYNIVQRYAR